MTAPRPAEERFWEKVDKSGECWVWTASRVRGTYGRFMPAHGVNRLAHRWIYEFLIGPIPPSWEVCHSCDNPPCVRPDHLFLGTKSDNMRDSFAKGRQRRDGEHSRRTHLTEFDVRVIREIAGWVPTRTVAEHYGISTDEVRTIALRRAWRNVA